jgi:FkbM family methyltransferase
MLLSPPPRAVKLQPLLPREIAMPTRPAFSSLSPPWNRVGRLAHALGWPAAAWFRWQRWRERRLGLSRPFRLYSQHARHALWCRPQSSDLDVFKQIFLKREYSCLDDARNVELVIDCGANVGYSSAYFLSRFPQCRVIAVEPDAGNFAAAERNLAPYGERVQLIRAGVWPRAAGLKISETRYRDGRQWAVQVREATPGETPDITAINIGSLLAESGCSSISILKIDIEAAERYVFAENCQPWLAAVENLVIELHDAACREVFFRAIRGLPLAISRCGELTVCRRLPADAMSKAA